VMRQVQSYVTGDVLEVGTGLGAFSRLGTVFPLSSIITYSAGT